MRALEVPFSSRAENHATYSYLPPCVHLPPYMLRQSAQPLAKNTHTQNPGRPDPVTLSRITGSDHSLRRQNASLRSLFLNPCYRCPREARAVSNRWTVTHLVGFNAWVRHRSTEQAPPSSHRGLPHVSHLNGNQKAMATWTIHDTSYEFSLEHLSQRCVPDQTCIHRTSGTSTKPIPPHLPEESPPPHHVKPPSHETSRLWMEGSMS
jgi:hypothetical protein